MKDPYEVLGLNQGASREEVIKRYGMLLRRRKAHQIDPERNPLDFDINEVNEAYNHLMGYDIKVEDPKAGRRRPILKLLGIDAAKFDNFWHYNWLKIAIMLVVGALAVSFAISIINNKPFDLYITTAGDIYLDQNKQAELQERIIGELGDMEKVLVDTGYMGLSDDPSFNMAVMQRFMAQIAAREIDIILTDRERFDFYVKEAIFMPLEEILPESMLDADYFYEGDDEEGPRITGHFGIDVSDMEFFSDFINIGGEDIIFTVVVNSKRMEKVTQFIETYIVN